MGAYWTFTILTVAAVVVLPGLAVYLAITSFYFEIEFKSFPPTIRVTAFRK